MTHDLPRVRLDLDRHCWRLDDDPPDMPPWPIDYRRQPEVQESMSREALRAVAFALLAVACSAALLWWLL